MVVIAGIGYEGRSAGELVEALGAAQIELLLDVREVPWSRKPGLSKTELSRTLAEAGIDYLHLKAAGNPREIRTRSADASEILSLYRTHLTANDACLVEIYELATKRRVALLCYERDPGRCHRSVLLEELRVRWPDVSPVPL